METIESRLEQIEKTLARIESQTLEFKNIKNMLDGYMESERRYRSLYEKSPDLLRSVNLEGKIIDCNETYAKNFGYVKEEAIGMSIFDHTAEKSMDIMKATFKEWLSTGHDFNKVIWCKRKDKSEFKTLMSIANLYDDGVIVGRLASLRLLGLYDPVNDASYGAKVPDHLLEAL